jgi:D-galactarolactone cycloisomerase
VEVETNEGIVGIGSCSGNEPIVEAVIERVLKPTLIGKDPFNIEELWEAGYFAAGLGNTARKLSEWSR